MKNIILILLSMLSLFSCKPKQNLPTVEQVDITKYMGTWYEIARLPNSFEKGLECVTANYSIKDNGKIKVLNKGYLIDNKDEYKTAEGTAWVPQKDEPGKLKVTFFWPFAANYFIIALNNDYSYALVGDPSRKYLWVLSRTKTIESDIYFNLMNMAQEYGFNTESVIKVNQNCKE